MAKAKKAAKADNAKKPRTKTEIFASIAAATGLSKKDVDAVLNALTDEIKKDMSSSGPGVFTLPNLCKITLADVPAKPAGVRKDPFTGQMKEFAAKPASKKIKLRALKALKDMA